jgi:hypothetical protein
MMLSRFVPRKGVKRETCSCCAADVGIITVATFAIVLLLLLLRLRRLLLLPSLPPLSCSLDVDSLESRIQGRHLDTLWVVEVVSHLGLPVRGPLARPILRNSKIFPCPGGPTPALPGRI